MAYNSDGYIMIDFTEVDFRRTNQTIEGLYKRCVDVIGTNKFILVINANRKTPLPSVCSFINNQYVIESCIYTFAVSANDNLFIKRNEPDPSSLIDDTVITTTKTWSSDKINTELGAKADTSALANYQPLLTPVSPVSIDVNDNISVDLSGKQNVLTAGDNITIVNDVISAKGIKKLNYTGTGETTNIIIFPEVPKLILTICGRVGSTYYGYSSHFPCDNSIPILFLQSAQAGDTSIGGYATSASMTADDELTLIANSAARCFNLLDVAYSVYYI